MLTDPTATIVQSIPRHVDSGSAHAVQTIDRGPMRILQRTIAWGMQSNMVLQVDKHRGEMTPRLSVFSDYTRSWFLVDEQGEVVKSVRC